MFERSAQREESFTANPAAATTQVARSEAEGRGHPGRLCFAYFPSAGVPVAKQRKVGRPPGRDPASKNNHPAGSKKDRSEEHTSELQSPCNLVCRLLLEKKKRGSS